MPHSPDPYTSGSLGLPGSGAPGSDSDEKLERPDPYAYGSLERRKRRRRSSSSSPGEEKHSPSDFYASSAGNAHSYGYQFAASRTIYGRHFAESSSSYGRHFAESSTGCKSPSAESSGPCSWHSYAYGLSPINPVGPPSSYERPPPSLSEQWDNAELWVDMVLLGDDTVGIQGKWRTMKHCWSTFPSEDDKLITLHVKAILKQVTLQVQRMLESPKPHDDVPPLVTSTFFCDEDCPHADEKTRIRGKDGRLLWTRKPTRVEWQAHRAERVQHVGDAEVHALCAIRFFFGFPYNGDCQRGHGGYSYH